ncbi:MAG: hypothetical protein OEL53_06690 [Rhodospirillales bacterium]|nr:hypothetical protein [Rhodospirillales bacterium]
MMIVDPSQNAKGRLLPPDIPFRFFATALFFHILAWAVLFLQSKDAGGLSWPMLSALHLITLGVLAMTAAGASFQLLPVATKRGVRAEGLCRLVYWLLVAGVALFTGALVHDLPGLAALGGGLAALALFGMAILLIDNLMGVEDMPVVTGHAWAATLSLLTVEVMGGILALNLAFGFLENRGNLVRAHGILALFGFMGMLAQGFSTILLPMFALAPAPSEKPARIALFCNALGLLCAVVGALLEVRPLLVAGGLLGILGMAVLGWSLLAVYKKRLRKRTGFFFLPIWTGLAMGPLAILCGLAALFDLFANAGVLFLWVSVAGWLLTFLMGVLQRIMPFLASMHSVTAMGRTPLLSQLMAEGWAKAHFALHLTAVISVGAGLVVESPLAVRLGAAAGLLGALAMSAYGLELFKRVRRFKRDGI